MAIRLILAVALSGTALAVVSFASFGPPNPPASPAAAPGPAASSHSPTTTSHSPTTTSGTPTTTSHPPTISQTWSTTLNDGGGPIALSSPNVAQLPGGPAAVVGDRKGFVYAYYLAGATASPVPGWPYSDGGVPIDSTPSVAQLSGSTDTVFVGEGDAFDPTDGGYAAIAPSGATLWFTPENNPSTDPYQRNGVLASLAVGDLQGGVDVVAGSLGQEEDALNATSGAVLPGFPWYQGDSNFSTPALADLYRNGTTEIVEGGASHVGLAYERWYSDGGHLRVLGPTAAAGRPLPNQGMDCEYNANQEVDSSPAVGEFFGSSQTVGIVIGTGQYYAGASQTNQLMAFTTSCQLVWSDALAGLTSSSPALADVLGNGQLQVVEASNDGSSGTVYVLDGDSGHVDWQANVPDAIFGSVVTADLFGSGQDVLVPTTSGVAIFSGTGQYITTLAPGNGFQNSPLVTEDPNGTVGITLAGYNGYNQGVIFHYEIAGSDGSKVGETGSWPMFHHDPQLTGDAGTGFNPQVPCNPPAKPAGFWEAAADGGIFSFGNVPYCGSTSGIAQPTPVVAVTAAAHGSGYWLASANGGIFAFGGAQFYGSMGGRTLAAPVVDMVSVPDGKGYWLVASDGGVFSFGDAGFYGSMGGQHLSEPIVGIASTPDGKGYWEVASDGGVFAFGDARFYGSMSGRPLGAPVVGMAAAPNGRGYWLVASDGGVFAFGDARFHGSMNGRPLAAPIVGIASTPDGRGYWEVASDGGTFAFDAPFLGSMHGTSLAAPVVGMAGVG